MYLHIHLHAININRSYHHTAQPYQHTEVGPVVLPNIWAKKFLDCHVETDVGFVKHFRQPKSSMYIRSHGKCCFRDIHSFVNSPTEFIVKGCSFSHVSAPECSGRSALRKGPEQNSVPAEDP